MKSTFGMGKGTYRKPKTRKRIPVCHYQMPAGRYRCKSQGIVADTYSTDMGKVTCFLCKPYKRSLPCQK